ncbi:MAG: hypothetical protein ABIO83_01570, partial [Ilumatobacteraceae bacterium]
MLERGASEGLADAADNLGCCCNDLAPVVWRRHEIRWKPITMSETILNAEIGRRAGSSDSRRLRTEDKIPAVVYGHGMDPLSVSVDRRELRQALSGAAGMNTILDLTVD